MSDILIKRILGFVVVDFFEKRNDTLEAYFISISNHVKLFFIRR